jgi:hypothetical protein
VHALSEQARVPCCRRQISGNNIKTHNLLAPSHVRVVQTHMHVFRSRQLQQQSVVETAHLRHPPRQELKQDVCPRGQEKGS